MSDHAAQGILAAHLAFPLGVRWQPGFSPQAQAV